MSDDTTTTTATDTIDTSTTEHENFTETDATPDVDRLTDDTDVNTDDDDTDDDDEDSGMDSSLVFSTFGKVTVRDNSKVTVPADRAKDFGRAATYFSAHTNRHTLTVELGTTDAAKLFVKQLNSYAEDHNLSTSPKRDERAVTFRFAAKRDASKPASGPVTTTVKPASELKIPATPKPVAPKPTAPKNNSK